MSNTLTRAILATLTYSDHFHYPLTKDELYHRLIEHKTTPSELNIALKKLVSARKIVQTNNYYCLPGQSILVKQRKLYQSMSKPLLVYTQSLLPILIKIKNIKAIYLTGSLALSNTDGHDDIDLMIVVENGKLWTTRALLTLFTSFLSLRRSPRANNPMGKLCLNLYLTPKAFRLPSSRRSLYTAYELIQAVPLYDPHNTRLQLLASNSWLKDYLPNSPVSKFSKPPIPPTRYSIIENIFYYLQRLYMSGKITREYITRDAAFFHPNNPGKKVLKKLENVK